MHCFGGSWGGQERGGASSSTEEEKEEEESGCLWRDLRENDRVRAKEREEGKGVRGEGDGLRHTPHTTHTHTHTPYKAHKHTHTQHTPSWRQSISWEKEREREKCMDNQQVKVSEGMHFRGEA